MISDYILTYLQFSSAIHSLLAFVSVVSFRLIMVLLHSSYLVNSGSQRLFKMQEAKLDYVVEERKTEES